MPGLPPGTSYEGQVDLSHEALWAVCRCLPTDYDPWGQTPDEARGPDCSCGCRWYQVLEGVRGMDWGICGNPRSPRAGLLTFEHQGGWAAADVQCFEQDEDDEDDEDDSMDTQRPPLVTLSHLGCHGCGAPNGGQHGVSGRWFCGGCLYELAAWALAHGAPLAPWIYGRAEGTAEHAPAAEAGGGPAGRAEASAASGVPRRAAAGRRQAGVDA